MIPAERYRWLAGFVFLIAQVGVRYASTTKSPDAPPATKVTAVTYVHEKNDSPVPNGVTTAINKLNQQGIVATKIDQNVTDGTGQVPEQYKVSLPAAKNAGLPALVVMAGNTVRKVVKNPTSEAECLEAAK